MHDGWQLLFHISDAFNGFTHFRSCSTFADVAACIVLFNSFLIQIELLNNCVPYSIIDAMSCEINMLT
jgi:hypothetical protein